MLKILRTNSSNKHFITLVNKLDQELADRDGTDHEFYHQFNTISDIKYVLVGYQNDKPLGCGAIKKFDDKSMEVKRMYTSPESRGSGVASKILTQLEVWAKEHGFSHTILETGKRNPEAIALYKKHGYNIIPNYGQYIGISNSICFKKNL